MKKIDFTCPHCGGHQLIGEKPVKWIQVDMIGLDGDGVWACVWAYFGSLFPNINIWKYKNHEQGQYPFQSAVDLWYRGLIPSFDGKTWRLHSGKKAEVVWI